jgi:cation:H+ antiporter
LGGELLVRGSASLAMGLRVPPLVVGLTVVAYGTSAPEAAVTVSAARDGSGAVGLGNVIGSGIFNVLVVLGLSALVAPLRVSRQLIRTEVPIMIAASLLLWLLCLDGALGGADGALLLLLMLAYTAFTVRNGRSNHDPGAALEAGPTGFAGWSGRALLVLAGLGMLVMGAGWLVDGSVAAARTLGVSELVIGLTVVAAGTSLPEVAASLVASLRGQREIAIGNVVGSNIFNVLFAVGAAAFLAPGPLHVPPAMLAFDLPLLLAVQVACLPIFFRNSRIDRWEGALFVAGYAAYLTYVILDATGHDALEGFSWILVTFVLPFLAATLVALGVQGVRDARRGTPDE